MTIGLGVTGELRTGWIGAWAPGIGDPNVMGWITVVAYLSVAYLCFAVHRGWLTSAGTTIKGGPGAPSRWRCSDGDDSSPRCRRLFA